MADYRVPDDYETLAEALAEALASADKENSILISRRHIPTTWHEVLDGFSASRRLTIRPARGLSRAAIISNDGWHPIFNLSRTGYVTFQDLDILRRWTTFSDLMFLADCRHITLERCRVGSIWPSGDSGEWSNLRIKGPGEVMIRNSIFFAHVPGTFCHGIRTEFDTAQANSLRLYNNVVADHREFGVHATSPMISDAFLVLRNNVVVNHPDAHPEPVPYYSSVFDMIVETSHNTAFVSLQVAEDKFNDDATSISGEEGAGFLRRSRAQIEAAFVQHTWLLDPEWNPNLDLFRLVGGGPLHSELADAGIDIRDGVPDDHDVAVTDDIEGDPRPGGIPRHTDRGADQIRDDDSLLAPLDPASGAPLATQEPFPRP